MIIGAYIDTGGYGVGGFEIWRLWVPPHFPTSMLFIFTNLQLRTTIVVKDIAYTQCYQFQIPNSELLTRGFYLED